MQYPIAWGSKESLHRWPDGLPPEVTFPKDEDFTAGSLHTAKAVTFWKSEILPTVGLPRGHEDIILNILDHGLSISDKFSEYSGLLYKDGKTQWVSGVPSPPPSSLPNHKINNTRHQEFLKSEVNKLLAQGVISVATTQPHLIMPLMVAENAEGKMRLILDARFLNCFLDPEKFKLPSVTSIIEGLEPGDLMLKIDFKSGFYNMLIAEADRSLVAFQYEGVTYVFNATVMGLNISPFHFQLMTDTVKSYICLKLGCKGACYLDDLIFSIPKTATARERAWAKWLIHDILHQAGFIRAMLKCSELFTTRIEILGFIVDTITQCVEVPQKKLNSTMELLEGLVPPHTCTTGTQMKLHKLQQLLGKLTHMSVAAPAIPLFLRAAYDTVAAQVPCFATIHSTVIRLGKEACADLRELLQLRKWSRLTKWESAFTTKVSLSTDASGKHWGACAFLDGVSIGDYGGTFPTFIKEEFAIHVKERLAVEYAIALLPAGITNAYLRIHVDNEVVRHTLLRGQKQDAASRKFARQLLEFQLQRSIVIKVHRITTTANIRADWVSRLHWRIRSNPHDKADHMLARHIFLLLQQVFQLDFTIDAFASKYNRQLWRYIALQDNEYDRPVAVNAFNYSFTGEIIYANPPFAIIAAVWRHLKNCKAQGVLIAPNKRSAEWWSKLVSEAKRYITIAKAGQPDVCLQASTNYTRAVGPLPWDLVAFHFDFRGR